MTGTAERLLRVEPIMGTVVGVDIRDPRSAGQVGAVDRFFDALREIDRRFSPWRADSEISRVAAGELPERDASADLRWILAVCDHLATSSGGAFDARHHRPDAGLDPSGFVKGWAIEEAATQLEDAGIRNYAVNAGGDILVRGRPDAASGTGSATAGRAGWRVGIRHPDRADRVATVISISDLAVATSGLYERGAHIRDPRTGAAPTELRSLTVVGPSLAWADAYATAGFVMGLAGITWVTRHPGYHAIAITADDRIVRTASEFSGSSQPAALSWAS